MQAMTQATVQPTQWVSTTQTRGSAESGLFAQAAGGDPFLQIIQNMVAQMGEEQTTQFAGNDEQDEALLAQFAAMFLATPEAAAQFQQSPEALLQALSAMQGSMVQPIGEQTTDASAQMHALLQMLSDDTDMGLLKQQGLEDFSMMLRGVQDVMGTTQQSTDSAALLAQGRSFRATIEAVRQALQQDSASQELPELDIDALQAQVQSRSAVPMMQANGEVPLTEQPLVEQLQQGILENTAQGNKTFTIKLQPETLGEVTVQLQEQDGKLVVRISAASEQAARMINADLSALQDAVRPMQVEVQQAVTQVNQSDEFAQQQFSDMGAWQFANQQQQRQNAQQGGEAMPWSEAVEADAGETEPIAPTQAPDSALNLYI